MDEKQIMDLITSEFSWEQIIYKIIAWEGLDPWDLNLVNLSESFSGYISKMDKLDFRIPAKYVIIASILLRMKSDHLRFLDIEDESEELEVFESEIEGSIEGVSTPEKRLLLNPITVPPKRFVRRKVTIEDLISSLRKALNSSQRREIRRVRRRGRISIRREDISQRISLLYDKINNILKNIKKEEVEFSKIVGKWERNTIVDLFLPLMHLDNEGKVECKQKDFFEEIFIKKANKKAM